MNSAPLAFPRPQRYAAASYSAFILPSDGTRTHPLNIGEPDSLSGAVDAAKVLCAHKDMLAIRVEQDGEAAVHLFAIRKKAPRWLRLAGEHLPRRIEELYAHPVCVLAGEVL